MIGLRRNFANFFKAGVFSIVGPGKEKSEDAYFIGKSVLSLADGVGGWSAEGIDPSKYPWELMQNIEKYSTLPIEDSKTLLKTAASDCTEIGTSTCALIVFEQDSPVLDTTNMGDSGFYVYRKTESGLKLVDKSVELLHGFNFPFQLGKGGDNPRLANCKNIKVEDKDYILLYSDGLSDNLWEENTRNFIQENIEKISDFNQIAKSLAEVASEKFMDEKYISPFAAAAKKHFNQNYVGGKPDDITIIFAQVHIE